MFLSINSNIKVWVCVLQLVFLFHFIFLANLFIVLDKSIWL